MTLPPLRLSFHETWFQKHCSGVLDILAVPYGIAVKTRAGLYEWGWIAQRRLPRPVISVGNLTVGGTGKTPVVMWLANWLQAQGVQVGILSRGYRRPDESKFLLVSDGQNVLTTHEESGDEPFLMARSCPGVVIAVGSDRYQLGGWVLKRFPIDCFILDDGFQHLGLHRDLNFLLIDALGGDGLQKLLPAGKLREPLSAAKRATALCVTRANFVDDIREILHPLQKVIGNSIPSICIQFHAGTLRHLSTNQTEPVDWVTNKPVMVFSGIGNASAFRATVVSLGVTILDEMVFPDHFTYMESHLNEIRFRMKEVGVSIVLTTEKDAVKLEPLLNEKDEIWAVGLDVTISEGREHLEQLVKKAVAVI